MIALLRRHKKMCPRKLRLVRIHLQRRDVVACNLSEESVENKKITTWCLLHRLSLPCSDSNCRFSASTAVHQVGCPDLIRRRRWLNPVPRYPTGSREKKKTQFEGQTEVQVIIVRNHHLCGSRYHGGFHEKGVRKMFFI